MSRRVCRAPQAATAAPKPRIRSGSWSVASASVRIARATVRNGGGGRTVLQVNVELGDARACGRVDERGERCDARGRAPRGDVEGLEGARAEDAGEEVEGVP